MESNSLENVSVSLSENVSTPKSETKIVVVESSKKSVGLALLLTLLFGPIGMLYSTILGAVIMLIVSSVVGFFTFGIGLLVTWPIQLIWAALAASRKNKKAARNLQNVLSK